LESNHQKPKEIEDESESSVSNPQTQLATPKKGASFAVTDEALKLAIAGLKPVEKEFAQKFIAFKDKKLKEQSTAKITKQIPGLCTVEDKKYFLIPSNVLYIEDNPLSALIFDSCSALGYEIKLLNEVAIDASRLKSHQDFFLGLWMGMFALDNLKRNKSKKGQELGRACMFALRVRECFEHVDFLGANALIEDNTFFGNGRSKEHIDKNAFELKVKLKEVLLIGKDDKTVYKAVYTLIINIARLLKLDYLKQETYNHVIKDNVRPLDDVIQSSYRAVIIQTGKGKKKKTEIKLQKPHSLRASPLFLKDEMKLIEAYTKPVFTSLQKFSKEYLNRVFSDSFDSVYKAIHDDICARWELLARFANVTKKRLIEVRQIADIDKKIKKAAVQPEHVAAILLKRKTPVSDLIQELLSILGDLAGYCAAKMENKEKISKPESIRNSLTKHFAEVYKNHERIAEKQIIAELEKLAIIEDKVDRTNSAKIKTIEEKREKFVGKSQAVLDACHTQPEALDELLGGVVSNWTELRKEVTDTLTTFTDAEFLIIMNILHPIGHRTCVVDKRRWKTLFNGALSTVLSNLVRAKVYFMHAKEEGLVLKLKATINALKAL